MDDVGLPTTIFSHFILVDHRSRAQISQAERFLKHEGSMEVNKLARLDSIRLKSSSSIGFLSYSQAEPRVVLNSAWPKLGLLRSSKHDCVSIF